MRLGCAGRFRSKLVEDLPDDTLMDRLSRDDPPAWLTEVDRDPAAGSVLYRVAAR